VGKELFGFVHMLETTYKIENYIDLAKKFAKEVEDLGIPIEEMYIFGSRTVGKGHKDSDLDLCVISSAFGMDDIAERVLLTTLSHDISVYIEPHPFSIQAFNNKYDPFVKEIKRTGIKII